MTVEEGEVVPAEAGTAVAAEAAAAEAAVEAEAAEAGTAVAEAAAEAVAAEAWPVEVEEAEAASLCLKVLHSSFSAASSRPPRAASPEEHIVLILYNCYGNQSSQRRKICP